MVSNGEVSNYLKDLTLKVVTYVTMDLKVTLTS